MPTKAMVYKTANTDQKYWEKYFMQFALSLRIEDPVR